MVLVCSSNVSCSLCIVPIPPPTAPTARFEDVVEGVGTELLESAVLAQVDGHLAQRAVERSLAIIESLDGDEQDEYINPEKSPFVLEL